LDSNKISKPDIQADKEGDFIRFAISDANLPTGTNLQEAIQAIQDVLERRLSSLGIRQSPEGDNPFNFEPVSNTDLYLMFTKNRNKSELKDIISKLQLGGNPPLLTRPPEIPEGDIRKY